MLLSSVWSFLHKPCGLSVPLQVIRDPPVPLLVHLRAAEPVRHQREGSPRVHGVRGGDDVRDVQRHLAGGAAQHADRHDEQLLPAHRCEFLTSVDNVIAVWILRVSNGAVTINRSSSIY